MIVGNIDVPDMLKMDEEWPSEYVYPDRCPDCGHVGAYQKSCVSPRQNALFFRKKCLGCGHFWNEKFNLVETGYLP